MDGRHFDDLARNLSSRRTAIGGVLAGLLLPFGAAARKKGKDQQRTSKRQGKRKGKNTSRVTAQESCWRAAACIPGKNTNVSRCDLSGVTTFPSDSTGSNLSRANLTGVNARGVNFTRANLSGACLVGANFTGATFANNTNLANAIFCRTIMPDGTPNNSGCGSATACCTTCIATGNACGTGIGGSCCGATQCLNGTCQVPCTPATCESLNACGPNVEDGCGGTLSCDPCEPETCGDGFCLTLVDGATLCYSTGVVPRCQPCSSAADCVGTDEPYCITRFIHPDGEIVPVGDGCPSQAAVCINVTPC